MSTSVADLGHAKLVFETTDTQVDPSLVARGDQYGIEEHSGKLEDAYAQLKSILQDTADDLGAALASHRGAGLSSVAVEFALSFAAEANVWVVKAGGQGSIKATLTWDLKQSE